MIQIFATFPKFKNTCKNPGIQTWLLYFAHHALDVFLFWSVLFLTTRTEFFLHLLAVIIVGIHWFTYDNKCIATVIMNRMCDYPDSEWLDSLKNMFGLRLGVGIHPPLKPHPILGSGEVQYHGKDLHFV